MDTKATLTQLMALANQMGIEVRYELLPVAGTVHLGGYCRIWGKPVVIVNKRASKSEQIKVLLEVLAKQDLALIYLKPSLRKLLEETKDV